MKKYMTDFELEKLATEVETGQRELTNEDVDILMELFLEKFGTAAYGKALNPRFLIDEPNPEDEQPEVLAWQQKEIDNIFDEKKEIPKDISLDFMCELPEACESHQKNHYACRCIRENFDSPVQFKQWLDGQMYKLADELQDLLPEKK